MLKLLWELVRKDLRIYLADRRSVIISFLTPVALACFVAFLWGSASKSNEPKKVSILLVDQDGSAFSKDLASRLGNSPALSVKTVTEEEAKSKVSSGDTAMALIVPKGFGEIANHSLFGQGTKPEYRVLADPSRTVEVAMAKGAVIRTTMETVAKQVSGSDDDQMPFTIKQEDQAAANSAAVGGAAHAFAGMGMQGLLFWAIESAMTLLRERRQGIWRRLRASPVSPWMFLLGKAISATIRALAILFVVFGFGMLLFHFRINPSWRSYLGFGLIAFGASLMSATFGLLVAALGRNEQQSRGLSILAVLVMCMLGGAWFPMFMMPQFMQNLSKFIPLTWAVNGFDDMTWRGMGLHSAVVATAALVGFSVLFGAIALKRIRWEPEAG